MEDRMEKIERTVLEEIRPRREDREKADKVLGWVLGELNRLIEEQGVPAQVRVEGSYAKDTWLRTSPEIDVFILLEPSLGREFIKNKFFPRLLEWFSKYNPLTRYSEHPYLVLRREGIEVEIVPALAQRAPGRPLTPVDRTPLHTEYVRKKARDPHMRDQIRLAKQFARNIGVYGAEIAVEGFSGYLIELLTLHYGGFRQLVREASRWRPPVMIDPENHYRGDRRKLLEKFGEKPMVVVDPVDPERNVAAALSLDKMAEMSLASTLYLRSPSRFYFFLPPVDPLELKRLSSTMEPYSQNVLVVRISLKEPEPPDNLWGQVKRLARAFSRHLDRAGYRVLRCAPRASDSGEKALIACLLETPILPHLSLARGPPFTRRENSVDFLERHMYTPGAGPWVREGRLESFVQRRRINCVDEAEEALTSVMPMGLRDKATTTVGLLPWLWDEFVDEERVWVMEFLWGKPRWLLPYLFTRRGVYAIPRERPPPSARE